MISTSLAFCNDCDFMTWNGYREVHSILNELNLPAGDSFWLFDPSGSDMALFTHDLSQKGPRHEELLEEICAGRIDVLHSAGSYGEKFNRGYRPNRSLIAGALEYLVKHDARPKIWSNHGDVFNTQNIGGADPAGHHLGDSPEADVFILDLLVEFGIEFFWLDRLLARNAKDAYRLVSPEITRSGHTINTFMRFLGLSKTPNGKNLGEQLSVENLKRFQEFGQSTVLYQHWGCHHGDDGNAFTAPLGAALSNASIQALERLAEAQQSGEMHVSRLYELLVKERDKPLHLDVQRVGAIVVTPEKEKQDNFYFNQYNKYSVDYFRSRLSNLDVTGRSALDAGCGVGQWSFALSELGFTDVQGIDASAQAFQYLTEISRRIRQHSPNFQLGSIESLPYADASFDLLISYGVIFCAHVDVALEEFYRVLKPKAEAYICLNADGWYQYLIDERFLEQSLDNKIPLALPLWNAFFDRVGGGETFIRMSTHSDVCRFMDIAASPLPVNDAKELIVLLMGDRFWRWQGIVDTYSDQTLQLVAEYARACLHMLKQPDESTRSSNEEAKSAGIFSALRHSLRLFSPKPAPHRVPQEWLTRESLFRVYRPYIQVEGSTQSRAYQPDEFRDLAYSIGFSSFLWGADATIARAATVKPVKPIYEENYKGAPAVWECLLSRD